MASGSALEFVFRYEGSAPLVLEQGSFGVGGNAVLQQERGGVSSAGLAISSEWRSSSDGEFLSGGRWNQGLNCATDSWRTTCTDNQQSQTIFENNNFLEGGASAPNSFNFAFFERSPEVVLSPGGGIRILISFGVSGSGSGIGSTATANGLNSSYFDLLLPESVSFSIGDFAEQFPLGVSFVSTADSTSSPPVDNGDSSGDPSPVPLPAAAWMLLSALTGAFSIKRWSRPANGGRERSRTSS